MTQRPYGSAAKAYLAAGYWPLPLPPRKKASPPEGYTGRNGRKVVSTDVTRWAAEYRSGNIGLRLPRGVAGIDVDAYKDDHHLAAWEELVARCGPLPPAPWCSSRDDGVSGVRLFRVPEDWEAAGKLPEGGNGVSPGEVIQWHHRYVVCPPSIHPDTGRAYRWRSGSITKVADLPSLPESWLEALSVAAAPGQPTPRRPSATMPVGLAGTRPGDDFNARGDWMTEILGPHGWTLHHESGGTLYVTRPGKNVREGHSATIGHSKDGVERLYVFSADAAPFKMETPYSKFTAFALLNHGGDHRAAARELGRAGYGTPPPRTTTPDGSRRSPAEVPARVSGISDDGSTAETRQATRPTLAPRTDGSSALAPIVEIGEKRKDKDEADAPYAVINGCLTWHKPTREGTAEVRLGTFDARIAEEVVRDDGTEQALTWLVRVKAADGRAGEVLITPEQLGRPQQWAAKAVGLSGLVMPGLSIADHLRAAVHSLSSGVPRKTVYTHTGWRRLEERHAYLTSTGALGANGLDASVTVDLGPLDGYALPFVRDVRDVRDAVQKSLALLDVAPDKVAVPVLAAVYRAPLPLAPDCSVWLYGRSGTFKTAITAIAQQHYGPSMDAQALPGNWTSTANALEAQAFTLDGALFVVDDYSPDATKADAQRRVSAADRLTRGSANRSGRGRMRPDGSLRPAKPPRAQVLTSAEDVPPGVESMRARAFVAEISRGDVDLPRLSALQDAAAEGILAVATAGYIKWLARRYDADSGLPQALSAGRTELRDQARAEGHPRYALNIASLALGWREFLAFAAAAGAITAEEGDALWARAWKALVDVGAEQERYGRDAEPARVYLQSLAALVTSGRACLADTHGRPPANAERWGWTLDDAGEGSYRTRGDLVGWVDGEDMFLQPDAAYAAVRQFAEKSGTPFGNSKNAVHKALHEKGLLASVTGPGRLTIRKRTASGNPTVLHIAVKTLDEYGGSL